MLINVSFDPSVTGVNGAPDGFVAAVNYVAKLYGDIFTNNVTINIAVGFGEVRNASFAGAGASWLPAIDQTATLSFDLLKSALKAHDVPDAWLPAEDPTGGQQNFQIPMAQARALGLTSYMPTVGVDGYVGFSNTPQLFDYGLSGSTTAGAYDFVGVVEHEFSEVMGRSYFGPSALNSALNMYRYTSPGVLALGSTSSTITPYFSTDGGATRLQYFNNPNQTGGGDYAD